LELGFPCVGLLGDLFLCLILFLWGKVRGPSAGSLLSVCYAGLMTVFQFCNVIWLWMLLTGSGDELCEPLSVLFQAPAYHPPTVSLSAIPDFVYWKFTWRLAPCPHLVQFAQSTPFPLLHVPLQFLVYYPVFLFFVFLQGRGLSVQGVMLFYSRLAVGIQHTTYLLTCWSESPKQVWSQHLVVWEPSCFLR
jgi:hypothetical protein